MTRPVSILLLVPLLLLPACGRTGTAAEPTTGVRGAVMSGPRCPVETAESPCPDLPVRGVTVRATTGTGEPAGSTVTDDRGRFEIRLAPGAYTLEPVLEGGGPPFARPQDVTVPDVGFVEATLVLDTGIRTPVGTG